MSFISQLDSSLRRSKDARTASSKLSSQTLLPSRSLDASSSFFYSSLLSPVPSRPTKPSQFHPQSNSASFKRLQRYVTSSSAFVPLLRALFLPPPFELELLFGLGSERIHPLLELPLHQGRMRLAVSPRESLTGRGGVREREAFVKPSTPLFCWRILPFRSSVSGLGLAATHYYPFARLAITFPPNLVGSIVLTTRLFLDFTLSLSPPPSHRTFENRL